MEVIGDKLYGNFLPQYLGRAWMLLDIARTRWLDAVKEKIYIYIFNDTCKWWQTRCFASDAIVIETGTVILGSCSGRERLGSTPERASLPRCYLWLKKPSWQWRWHKRSRFYTSVRKIPWRRAWQPTSVFSPGESPGALLSPWTEELSGLEFIG